MSGRVKKTVLIAVDGSNHSECAFDWFVKTLYCEGDHVIAVVCPQVCNRLSSVSENGITVENVKHIIDEEKSRVEGIVNKFKDKVKTAGINGEVRTADGTAPEVSIVSMAEEANVSFIVVGARGRGTKRRTPIGHVCEYVVEQASVPVMISKHVDAE